MDLEIFQVIKESVKDLHNSDRGLTVEIMIYLYILVWKATRPVTKAIDKLVMSNNIQDAALNLHETRLDDHGRRLDVHEKRIVVLETDKPKGDKNGKSI